MFAPSNWGQGITQPPDAQRQQSLKVVSPLTALIDS
jgi:hypothetical protein